MAMLGCQSVDHVDCRRNCLLGNKQRICEIDREYHLAKAVSLSQVSFSAIDDHIMNTEMIVWNLKMHLCIIIRLTNSKGENKHISLNNQRRALSGDWGPPPFD